jgi:hypothetical protein
MLAVLPNYLARTYVPDEAWFRDLAAEKSAELAELGLGPFIRFQENELGYGAIYWIAYALLGRWFDEPIVAARWLAWLAMATPPACAALLAQKQQIRGGGALAVALWFTFPVAWWTGKLTGPETFSLAASTIGATLVLWRAAGWRAYAAGVALGLACGLKLTAAPAVAFAVVVVALRSERRWRAFALLAAGLVGGFLLANPFILFQPRNFAENVLRLTAEPTNYRVARGSLEHFVHLFWNGAWEWDAVFRGGLLNWSLAPAALALWLVVVWRARASRAVIGALAVAVVAATVMCFVQARYLGWYWFPTVALIPLATSEVQLASRRLAGLSVVLVLISLASSQATIRAQRDARLAHEDVLRQAPALYRTIEQTLADQSEQLTFVAWCTPPELPAARRLSALAAGTPPVREHAGHRAYDWIVRARYLIDLREGEAAGIVVYRPYRQLWEQDSRSQLDARVAVREVPTGDDRFACVIVQRRPGDGPAGEWAAAATAGFDK